MDNFLFTNISVLQIILKHINKCTKELINKYFIHNIFIDPRVNPRVVRDGLMIVQPAK